MGIDDPKTTILDLSKIPPILGKTEKRRACFIVIHGREVGKMYKLDDRRMFNIGRTNEVEIRIEDEGVSRKHAKILQTAEGIVLEDLSSTNGTFCNGERVTRRVLADGDKVQIGSTTILKFSLQDEVEEEFLKQQYQSATRDPLTGSYNKKFLLDRLPSEVAFAKRHNKIFSIALLDIDHFKKINDTYGHQAGDFILRLVVEVIMKTIRVEDILCRYGGEEFVIIMRETNTDSATIAAERVRRNVEQARFNYEGKPIPVTVSLGIATYHDGKPGTAEELVKQADGYLYRAKEKGRNRSESATLS